MMKNIGLHEPYFSGNEQKYLLKCVKDNWVSSAGKFVDIFEKKICQFTKSKNAVAVLNGTIGLQMSLILAGTKKNDEVIVPTITFVATINAIKHAGAEPIFMDTEENFNINQSKCIDFILTKTIFKNNSTFNISTGKKIVALMVVHTFGNAANFDKLFEICKKRNIKIIEDAAESIGTKYIKGKFKNKHTGTVGDFGVISFNGNKTITTGNGGVILIKDNYLTKKARYLITQAKDKQLAFIHDEVGYNFRLSNICAALGVAQLENINFILKKKKKINIFYKKKINIIKGLSILESPIHANNNYWLNLLKVDKNIYKRNAKKLLYILNKNGIQARPIWKPNHQQKPFRFNKQFKISSAINNYKDFICLPSSAQLSIKELNFITKVLKK